MINKYFFLALILTLQTIQPMELRAMQQRKNPLAHIMLPVHETETERQLRLQNEEADYNWKKCSEGTKTCWMVTCGICVPIIAVYTMIKNFQ